MSDVAMHHDDMEQRARPRNRGARFPWLVLLMLAWLVYEITARPALAVVVCCPKFGWEEFRTALWLRSSDTQRGRGWACFFIYIAFGLWRIVCMAFGLMILMIPLFDVLRNAGGAQKRQVMQDLEEQAIGIAIVLLVGLCLASAVTLVGIAVASWSGSKLWVDRRVHWDRRDKRWPPSNEGWLVRKNKTAYLSLPSLILLLVALMIFTLVGMIDAAGGKFRDIGVVISMLLLVGLSFGLLVVQEFLSRHIFASAPSECWGHVYPATEPDGK